MEHLSNSLSKLLSVLKPGESNPTQTIESGLLLEFLHSVRLVIASTKSSAARTKLLSQFESYEQLGLRPIRKVSTYSGIVLVGSTEWGKTSRNIEISL